MSRAVTRPFRTAKPPVGDAIPKTVFLLHSLEGDKKPQYRATVCRKLPGSKRSALRRVSRGEPPRLRVAYTRPNSQLRHRAQLNDPKLTFRWAANVLRVEEGLVLQPAHHNLWEFTMVGLPPTTKVIYFTTQPGRKGRLPAGTTDLSRAYAIRRMTHADEDSGMRAYTLHMTQWTDAETRMPGPNHQRKIRRHRMLMYLRQFPGCTTQELRTAVGSSGADLAEDMEFLVTKQGAVQVSDRWYLNQQYANHVEVCAQMREKALADRELIDPKVPGPWLDQDTEYEDWLESEGFDPHAY